jgi:hypothetical protein
MVGGQVVRRSGDQAKKLYNLMVRRPRQERDSGAAAEQSTAHVVKLHVQYNIGAQGSLWLERTRLLRTLVAPAEPRLRVLAPTLQRLSRRWCLPLPTFTTTSTLPCSTRAARAARTNRVAETLRLRSDRHFVASPLLAQTKGADRFVPLSCGFHSFRQHIPRRTVDSSPFFIE